MRRMIRAWAVAAIGLCVAGCDVEEITLGNVHFTSDRHRLWLETDRPSYVVRYTPDLIEIDLGYTFRNRGRRSVAVPRCIEPHRPALDRLILGEWHEVFVPHEECWGEPLVLAPGAVRSFAWTLRAARRPASAFAPFPPFRASHVPGTYRLRWQVYEHDPQARFRLGPPLPLEFRVSNTFRLVD